MKPRIVYDISITMGNRFNSGIQRVVLNLANQFLENPKYENYELVVVTRRQNIFGKTQFYRVDSDILKWRIGVAQKEKIHQFSLKVRFLGLVRKSAGLSRLLDKTFIFAGFRFYQDWKSYRNSIFFTIKTREPFTFSPGDIFFSADAFWTRTSVVRYMISLRKAGIKIAILIHDIFPVTNPEWFYSSDVKIFSRNFSRIINQADFLFAVSIFTAKEVLDNYPKAVEPQVIRIGMEKVALKRYLDNLNSGSGKNLVLVGTIEPRKNYEQIIDWLTQIDWQGQVSIFGRKGWKFEKILQAIQEARHKDLDIVWHENASDADIQASINSNTIGVCASLAEGYGLPLREFRARGLGVVASHIPAFVEGDPDDGIFFFELNDFNSFRKALSEVSHLKRVSTPIYPTWKDSLDDILAVFYKGSIM